jgi:uncharacterized protein (TIGR03790 family)
MALTLLALALIGCRHDGPRLAGGPDPAAVKPAAQDPASRVLVVANADSPESLEIANYYVAKRHIPAGNLVTLHCPTTEDISQDQFDSDIVAPVKAALQRSKSAIDYLVTTHGVPLRYNSRMGYSVDAGLMAMESKVQAIFGDPDDAKVRAIQSPYYGANEHFTHAKYGLYLVTRLDGYTVADAKALVDRSLNAKPAKGLVYLQPAGNRTTETFGELQATLSRAKTYLDGRGFKTEMGPLDHYASTTTPLILYVTWGSNHGGFKQEEQNNFRFLPGAIAETWVSTSARTFGKGQPGQSKIADLIAQGVTGVKGYVGEPFTFALCPADLLLARYTSGFNLAESFYMASPTLKWKDVVIGDPLCDPFAQE